MRRTPRGSGPQLLAIRRSRRRGAGPAAAVLLLLAAVGCERLPTGPAGATLPPVRGITFVDWSADGYAAPAAGPALDALAETGANTVTLIVTAYQTNARSPILRANDFRTPTPATMDQVLQAARARGLALALKPHVDLDDGSWRGGIDPPRPDAWFESYAGFIMPWAGLAEAEGVGTFVVGTELAGLSGDAGRWRALIARVRSVFSGRVVYAASWDEAPRVTFWDAVDAVGVDYYFPVATRTRQSRFDLLAGWQPWLDRLERLHRQTGRPILLTEIGYRSVDGAGMHPYAFGSDEPLDLEEQADLYWAALQATGDRSWCEGLYWWNWPADGSGGPLDRDYTAHGKPAARVLADAWGAP